MNQDFAQKKAKQLRSKEESTQNEFNENTPAEAISGNYFFACTLNVTISVFRV
jgi:hypothetical protein